MCPFLRKRNMRNVDKEKHVTGASADVAATYERDGNYVDALRVFPCRRHARYVYVRRDILF